MTRLGRLLQDFGDLVEWDGTFDFDEEAGSSHFFARVRVAEQSCRVYVDAHEGSDTLAVYVYPPFFVKNEKLAEACVLVNAINYQARHGRLEIDPDDGELRYANSLNAEFVEPNAPFVRGMVEFGLGFLGYWMGALADVAMTEHTAKEILDEEEARCREAADVVEAAAGHSGATGRGATLH
jgi:hypothetical protein